jgi:hypothetical protein
MDDLQFTWDPAKAAANLREHGVSFEDASTVFRNPLAKVLPDPTHSEQEQRSLIIGRIRRAPPFGSLHGDGRPNTDHQQRDASARERREYEEHS